MTELTQSIVRELFCYNPETGAFTNRVRRSRRALPGKPASRVKNKPKPYLVCKVRNKTYFAHRLIWLYMTGEWPVQVDHADGNGLNNVWSNLSSVTRAQNAKNCRRQSNNTSGQTGVYWKKRQNNWEASIRRDNRKWCLGHYSKFEDAVAARKRAEKTLGFHPNHGSERPL